jgi:hypothetical protein
MKGSEGLSYAATVERGACARARVCARALVFAFCLASSDYTVNYLLPLDLHIWQVYHTH